jgi:hypothetical protein
MEQVNICNSAVRRKAFHYRVAVANLPVGDGVAGVIAAATIASCSPAPSRRLDAKLPLWEYLLSLSLRDGKPTWISVRGSEQSD